MTPAASEVSICFQPPRNRCSKSPKKNAGTVIRFGMRRLLTSVTEPIRAQAAAAAGYVNCGCRNVIDRSWQRCWFEADFFVLLDRYRVHMRRDAPHVDPIRV